MTEKWWQKPLRAVTLEFPAADVSRIDVKGIVAETARGSVNTLCVFTTGYYPGGSAFYQSAIAPHFPGLGERDLLAEALEAAHAHGQKVIAYIASIWGGRELYEQHPDWAQRKADGGLTAWDEALTSLAFCPNSPYRDYLESILDEISRNYAVDGFYFDEPSFQSWCACEHCQRKFQAEFNAPLPTHIDWQDELFQSFLAWRYRQISDWREALYRAVKTDERCVFFQGAFPLTRFSAEPLRFSGLEFPNPYQQRFGVDWYIPMAHAADLAHDARVGDVIHFELYRRSVHEPLWWYGVCLRYGQSIGRGKNMLILSMMAQTPFDLYGLPEAELRLSVAELLANSGSPLFARYYPDRVDQPAWDLTYDCLTRARNLEPYLQQRESLGYAALLFSETTLRRFDHRDEKPEHLGCLKGFAKALLQSQIPFDIITEADLQGDLNRYKVLVLPNAACLSAAAKAAVRQFVAEGGGVVASYETGMYDEHGNRSSQDDFSHLFGVSYGESEPIFTGFDVYMTLYEASPFGADIPAGKRIPTGGVQVDIASAGARAIASLLGGAAVHYGPLGEAAGAPSLVVCDSGEGGRRVYFAPPVGVRYLEFGVPDQRRLMAAAVRWAAGETPPVRVVNAPLTLALTAFKQPEQQRLVIHLVNSVQEEIIHPIEEVAVCSGVSLEVDIDTEVSKVEIIGEPHPPEIVRQGKCIRVNLPDFRYDLVVVISF